jgi:ketosteroid isomerase-like protein
MDSSSSALQRLIDLDAIKKVKSRYFQFLDAKRWSDYATLFTEDCRMWFAEGPEDYVEGRAAYVALVASRLDGVVTVHHGHMEDIEFVSADEAVGNWAMSGYGRWPDGVSHQAWGNYIETFERCADGEWRIREHRNIKRLRITPTPELAETRAGHVGCPQFSSL